METEVWRQTAPTKTAMETSPVSSAHGGDVAQRTTESPAATSTTAQTAHVGQDGPDGAAAAAPATLASTETPEVAGGTAGRQSRASSLHRAAQALLDAWDKLAAADSDAADALHEPIAGLRAAVTTTFAAAEPSRPPKATKQSQVPAMLSRTVVLRQSCG
jgi:hypothetical protein